MKALLEIHALQNFVPSNLNRDDTGSPKDAEFGGYRRGRISSQSLKRAMRRYVDHERLLGADELAVRTKRVVGTLSERIVRNNGARSTEEAAVAVQAALAALSLGLDDQGLAQYLLFMGIKELDALAEIIEVHWDALVASAGAEKQGKSKKSDAKKAFPKELSEALAKSLDGGKAVDLALFGRMLADLPDKSRDAAAQVAHAISTNEVAREFDFYTAVDDLLPPDAIGADMLGTVEFTSACYYRYIAIDLEKLYENLDGDRELLERGLQAFLKAAFFAAPSGKQNSFAAHNPPSFFAVSVRSGVAPRNLANAFERPVRPRADKSLTQESIERLDGEWKKLDEALGTGAVNEVAVLALVEGVDHLAQWRHGRLDDVIARGVDAARAVVK